MAMRRQETDGEPLVALQWAIEQRGDTLLVFVVAGASVVAPIVGGVVLDHLGVGALELGRWTECGGMTVIIALTASFVWAWRRAGLGTLPYGAWTAIGFVGMGAVAMLTEDWMAANPVRETVWRWWLALAFVWLALRLAPRNLIMGLSSDNPGLGARALTAIVLGGWVAWWASMVSHITRWPTEWLWWRLLVGGVVAMFVGGLALRVLHRWDPDWQARPGSGWWDGLPVPLVEQIKKRRQRSDRAVLVGALLFIVVGLGGFLAGYLLELAASVGLIALAVGCVCVLTAMNYADALDEQIHISLAEHDAEAEGVGEQNLAPPPDEVESR